MKTHSPNLKTVLMVEQALLDMGEYPTKKALRESLPKQIEYPTFNEILAYLEASGKIMYNKRAIIYTGVNNEKLENLINKGKIIKKR
jgi:hypothetical protein